MFSAQPFSGSGASLYLASGVTDPGENAIQFRKTRLFGNHFLRGPETAIGSTGITKTNRIDSVSDPTAEFSLSLTGYENKTLRLQVRTFKDDVEAEHNFRSAVVVIDGAGEDDTGILGTATLLSAQKRAGGIVRLRFIYNKALTGHQPDTFTAMRTAGPTSPADVPITALDAPRVTYEIDTPALTDAGTYTYKIQASVGLITADVLTGISITADASGPPAPTSGTAIPY